MDHLINCVKTLQNRTFGAGEDADEGFGDFLHLLSIAALLGQVADGDDGQTSSLVVVAPQLTRQRFQ